MKLWFRAAKGCRLKVDFQKLVQRSGGGDRYTAVLWTGVAVAFVALVMAWLSIDWQWSPVDDPGQALAMRALHESHPAHKAIYLRVVELASGDFAGGVFRPLAWIYPPLIYSLTVEAAHLVRLLMLMVTIAGPVIYFKRRGYRGLNLIFVLLILIIAASGLYQGLLLLSIQEVGGMMCIAIGLAIGRPAGRLMLFLLASFFKAPFLWVLAGYSIFLYRTGERKKALYSAGSAAAVFVISVVLSGSGTYTDRYRLNPLDPELWKSASQILDPANGALLIAALWWLVATKSRLVRESDFPIFAVGFAGYYAQMIPWGFTAYYMGPISFLLGLLILSVISPSSAASRPEVLVGLVLPLVVAAWVLKGSLEFVFQTNAVLVDSTICIVRSDAQRTALQGEWLYVTTSPEGPIRLTENIRYFNDDWSGQVGLNGEISDPTHALLVGQSTDPQRVGGTEICRSDLISLIELRADE